jgi:YjzC-like protein
MAKRTGLKPGETVPVSGIYQEIGPRGGKVTQVTSVQGEPLPPAASKGSTYNLVKPAKHKK